MRHLDPTTRDATRTGAGALALLALAATDFLSVLDGLLVAVALPDIQRALGFTQNGLGWVITAYVLVFAGCLLLGGRVADLYGRRRVLLIGYGFFAAGSLVAGLAATPGMLVAGRAVQGLGAAAMTPAGLSLLTVAFPDGPARNRALGIWAAAGSVGIPAGALLGGLITSSLGWRWVLLVNAPAALAAALLAAYTLPESRAQVATRRLDVPGAITGTAGLACLILAITQLEPLVHGGPGVLGQGVSSILVPVTAAAALLTGFVAVERRAPHPLLPARLLTAPGVLSANAAAAGLPVGLGAMMFIATQYLQQIHGFTPWETGLTYLALALPVMAGSPLAARLVTLLGRRRTAELGFALQAGGLLLLTLTTADSSIWTTIVPAFILTGAGAPIAYIPITAAAIDDVGDDSGLASGLFNTTQQVANAVALAGIATAVALGSTIDTVPAATPAGAPTITGLHAGFLAAAVMLAAAAAAALRLREHAD
jgi:EmrB/QacA subfamily drug resistance transporter